MRNSTPSSQPTLAATWRGVSPFLLVVQNNGDCGGDLFEEIYVLELSGNVKCIIVHRRFLMEKIIWYGVSSSSLTVLDWTSIKMDKSTSRCMVSHILRRLDRLAPA
ncbi:unnamed protein product [Prunus armeniaca]